MEYLYIVGTVLAIVGGTFGFAACSGRGYSQTLGACQLSLIRRLVAWQAKVRQCLVHMSFQTCSSRFLLEHGSGGSCGRARRRRSARPGPLAAPAWRPGGARCGGVRPAEQYASGGDQAPAEGCDRVSEGSGGGCRSDPVGPDSVKGRHRSARAISWEISGEHAAFLPG